MASMAIEHQPVATEAKPLAMVIFSGASIWPGIQGLWHWRKAAGELKYVFILSPPGAASTRGPAQTLQRLIELSCPGTGVIQRPGSPPAAAREVRDALLAWQNEYPGCRWLFDMTDVLPSLTSALTGFVGQPDVQVVYRDNAGDWFELAAAPEVPEPRKIDGIAPQDLNALPVSDLVWTQWGVSADALDFAAEKVEALPVKRLTQEGIARSWDWPAAFAACGIPGESPANARFARYLGAGLSEIGVNSLAHSLRLGLKRERKEKLELDLAASHNGRVLLMGLQLRSQVNEAPDTGETVMARLRQLLDARQKLAGLDPQMALLWPGRLFSESERELAKACGIEVIDQRDAPRVFSKLAAWLKITALPPEMAEVEALLVEQVAQRGRFRVFSAEDDRLRQQEADGGGPECVDIEAHLNRIRAERGQNWLLWATRTEIVLRLDRPDAAPVELPSLIQSALSSFGRVRVETTASGYDAIFARESGRLAKLRQAFAGFVNRRLETMVFVQARPHRTTPAPSAARAAERPVRNSPKPNQPPLGYGSLEDLDAAVDQALRNKPSSK
jgi:hypothetical protein